MPGATFEEGETVALRTVEEEDLDFFQEARNDARVRRPLTLNSAANGEQVREFYESAVCGDDGANLLVCVDGEPVGNVALFEEDDVAGTATIAYWLAPEHWGNGYATDAVALLCEHAFGDRRLHKLRADAIDPNDASRRVLEKLGFEREGVLRDEKFVDGAHVDVHRYGLLAAEWGGR